MELSFKEKKRINKMYGFIEKHQDFYDRVPAQLMIVDKAPDYILEGDKNNPCFIAISPNSEMFVILLVNSKSMDEVFKNIYYKKQVVQAFEVDTFRNYLDIDFSTKVTAAVLKKLMHHAWEVTKKLKIDCPQIFVVDADSMDTKNLRAQRRTIMRKQGNKEVPVGDVLLINYTGDEARMIHSLAHELRHCWQQYKTDDFYKDYKDVSEIGASYFLQLEEIDADAYASLYVESLGYDWRACCFDDENDYTENKDNSAALGYLQIIEARMKLISLLNQE